MGDFFLKAKSLFRQSISDIADSLRRDYMYYGSNGFYLTDKFDAIKEQSKRKLVKMQ